METRKRPLFSLVLPEWVRETLTLGGTPWTLFYEREAGPVLKAAKTGEWFPEVKKILEPLVLPSSYRVQVSLRTVPFLAGIFWEKKEIILGTANLHREMFLKELLSGSHDPQPEGEQNSFLEILQRFESLNPRDFPSVWERTTRENGLPPLLQEDLPPTAEDLLKNLVKDLSQKVRKYRTGPVEKMTDFGLSLTSQYALIRVHLLKFLAVLPSLDHDRQGKEVKRMFLEMCRRLEEGSREAKRKKWTGDRRPLAEAYFWSLKRTRAMAEKTPAFILAASVRRFVKIFAKRFIAGETIADSAECLQDLRVSGRDATLDQLGELVVSEREADHYAGKVLELIRGFRKHVGTGDLNGAGIPRAHVSIKVSALCSDFNPLSPEETYALLSPRLKKILLVAREEQVFIHVDAEHYHHRDLIFDLFRRTLKETPDLWTYPWMGVVLQAYLRDAGRHFAEILELTKERNLVMPVRLVKGAYWDGETVEAQIHSYNAPQFLNKEETDLHFRQFIHLILKEKNHLQLCLGSHNLADHCYAEALRTVSFPLSPVIEHQCLHMTYEALGQSMVEMGWVVRNYVPVGDLLVGMAYLVRRIMENSSQVGILNMMRMDRKKREFVSPQKIHLRKKEKGVLVRDRSEDTLSPDYFNVSPVRVYLPESQKALKESLETFEKTSLGRLYDNPFLLSEDQGGRLVVKSPSLPDRVVGEIFRAGREAGLRALEAADGSYKEGSWARALPGVRAAVLVKAAELFLIHRLELASLILWEGGKTIKEALADVDETIDFLNYYAREEVQLGKRHSQLFSRGVVVVIAPWNFPCAIPCGMAAAAVVAGNSVILKSSELTPLIAQRAVDLLHRAGVPKDVLIHLPGKGREVGAVLVEDPRTSGIVFTGSKEVGTWMFKESSSRLYENPLHHHKSSVKCITEMGGKNAIIITGNAEMDETVMGCLYSAFAHAGQKCSALSRILVDASIKNRFRERFTLAVKDLRVGPAHEFSTYMNPVISGTEKERLRKMGKEAVQEAVKLGGVVWVDESERPLPGHCLGPVVVELPADAVATGKTLADQELFGPVIHVIPYETLDEAVSLFNQTEYALTGGIFSQSQDEVDDLLSKLQAGNLYVNRSCTGARVAIEPFGGFKLSGTGPKAGGDQYVQAFHYFPPAENPGDKNGDGTGLFSAAPSPSRPLGKLSQGNSRWSPAVVEKILQNQESFLKELQTTPEGRSLAPQVDDFLCWLEGAGLEFLSKKHPNRPLPGQWTYNDYSFIKQRGIFLALEDRPHSDLFLDFLGAMGLGCGVSVLVGNGKILPFWQKMVAFWQKRGIGEEFLSLHVLSGIEDLQETVEKGGIGFYLVDGKEAQTKMLLSLLFKDTYREKHMISVHSPGDGLRRNPFGQLLLHFILVRSVSINTMRHGAPLSFNEE